MGTMIGKICFIYYKHIISGVVKNKEYFLENVTNLGLPLPLMKPDFPTLTSPMCVSYTHHRAHETGRNLVCRLLLEKKKYSKGSRI